MKEIDFVKYKKRGKDYHYKQINLKNPFSFNAYVHARYIKHILLLKKILQEKNISKSKKLHLLDMGCGDGVVLFLIKKHLAEYQFNFYGIDLSEIALETAKNKIRSGNFLQTNVYETNFQNDFFDVILSLDVIEHVNYPEKMLMEAKRIAKNGAIIIFGTPIRYTEKPLDKMHVHEFFPQEFKQLFSLHFTETSISFSHNLYNSLQYRKTFKFFFIEIGFYKYLYYLKTLFGKNPFLKKSTKTNKLYTYMYASAIKA